jgi:hypothetical protein
MFSIQGDLKALGDIKNTLKQMNLISVLRYLRELVSLLLRVK